MIYFKKIILICYLTSSTFYIKSSNEPIKPSIITLLCCSCWFHKNAATIYTSSSGNSFKENRFAIHKTKELYTKKHMEKLIKSHRKKIKELTQHNDSLSTEKTNSLRIIQDLQHQLNMQKNLAIHLQNEKLQKHKIKKYSTSSFIRTTQATQ